MPGSSSARRASEVTSCAASPPARSVRRQPPAKRVSPLNRMRSSVESRQTEPWCGPACAGPADGCCRTGCASPRRARAQAGWAGWGTATPGVGMLKTLTVGTVDGQRGAGGDDHLRVVADVVPVTVRGDDVAQQPAGIGRQACQPAPDGVAVSTAMASRVRSSAMTHTFVATGPVARCSVFTGAGYRPVHGRTTLTVLARRSSDRRRRVPGGSPGGAGL